MAYAVINKTGCGVHKGNCQIRLDFYLEPTDPRYGDTLFEGKANPFHTHFIYLDPEFTEDDIEREIDFHLPNFYKAFQDRWDQVQGGMRHGWGNRKIPEDHAKDSRRIRQCQKRIDKLGELSYKPEGKIKGQTYPATAIDVGPGALDRAAALDLSNYTAIDMTNPANDTGIIDTCEIWANTQLSGVKFGTFYGSGASWTNRAGATIGTVLAGSKRTFTGLSIAVSTNDMAGMYYTSGAIEEATLSSNLRYKAGDQFGTGTQTYSTANYIISIYGTGATQGATIDIAGIYAGVGAIVSSGLLIVPSAGIFSGVMNIASSNLVIVPIGGIVSAQGTLISAGNLVILLASSYQGIGTIISASQIIQDLAAIFEGRGIITSVLGKIYNFAAIFEGRGIIIIGSTSISFPYLFIKVEAPSHIIEVQIPERTLSVTTPDRTIKVREPWKK